MVQQLANSDWSSKAIFFQQQMRNVAMCLNPTNTQTAYDGLLTGASNAAKMQAITSCLPNQVGIFYGCQGLGCLNQTHPAKRRQAPNPHKRVSFKRTSPLTNVFVKPNEQCRACSNIVMARKRTFRETKKNGYYHQPIPYM